MSTFQMTRAKFEALYRCVSTFNAGPVTAITPAGTQTYAPGELFLRSVDQEEGQFPVGIAWSKFEFPANQRGMYETVDWPHFLEVTLEFRQ